MNTNIKTKSGGVSAYGFACGYIEQVETDTLNKQLYSEHGMYHVRSTRNNTPELNTQFDGRTSHAYIIWETYTTLSEARALYNKIK